MGHKIYTKKINVFNNSIEVTKKGDGSIEIDRQRRYKRSLITTL